MTILHRLPNGDFIDYGRHWRGMTVNGVPVSGEGPALHYSGEAAEVMRLVLQHMGSVNNG